MQTQITQTQMNILCNVSQPKSRRDDKLKINCFENRNFEVATIVYYEKLWKTIKIK